MRVYLACSSAKIERYIDYYKLIRRCILDLNHEIVADWVGRISNRIEKAPIQPAPILSAIDLREEGIKAIDKSDCLVADVSIPSASVGYQMAYALSKKIPVLCLYSLEFGRKHAPQIINASNSSILRVMSCKKLDIKERINEFIRSIPTGKLTKFNFIITPEIDKYIAAGAKKYKVSKSEFLRKKITEKLISDKQ